MEFLQQGAIDLRCDNYAHGVHAEDPGKAFRPDSEKIDEDKWRARNVGKHARHDGRSRERISQEFFVPKDISGGSERRKYRRAFPRRRMRFRKKQQTADRTDQAERSENLEDGSPAEIFHHVSASERSQNGGHAHDQHQKRKYLRGSLFLKHVPDNRSCNHHTRTAAESLQNSKDNQHMNAG